MPRHIAYECSRTEDVSDHLDVATDADDPGRVTGVVPPTTDMYTDDGGAFVIEVHLPNFDADNVVVKVEGGRLVVEAEQNSAGPDGRREYFLREAASAISHTIALPDDFGLGGVTANFSAGVLRVRVPPGDASGTRRMAVAFDGADTAAQCGVPPDSGT